MSPSIRFSFQHQSYKKIKSHVQYALFKSEGIVLITGRPGTGKTSLVDEITYKLAKSRIAVTKVSCDGLDSENLLQATLHALGVQEPGGNKATMLRNLEKRLSETRADGRLSVLMFDEAQTLTDDALEQIRIMTNYQSGGQPLVQVFLVGQSELRERVLTPAFEQLHQRILTSCHLEPLSQEETRGYIHHRLAAVGWKEGNPELAEELFPMIHSISQGIPRWINLICSRLLLHGMAEDSRHLSLHDLNAVLLDLREENLLPVATLGAQSRESGVAVRALEARSAD
ncbi:MAG: AAA family ATPase [Granulosicoccus sp.]